VPAALSPAVSSAGDFFAREGLCYAVEFHRQLKAAPLSPLVSARGDFFARKR